MRRFLLTFGAGGERAWDPRSRLGLAIICAAMIAGLAARYETFSTVSNAFTILLNITAIAIAGFGTALLLISGNIDLSIGGQYALISVVTGLVARDSHSAQLAAVAALVLGTLLGFTNGWLVRQLRINPLIVTLALAAIYRGFAFVFTNARSVFEFPDQLVSLGSARLGPIPLPVAIATLIFAVGSVILTRSVIGLRIYAIGGNEGAARLTGIDTVRTVGGLYTLNGALIGVISFLTIARLGSAQPSIGVNFELDVLTAVILGGIAFNGGGGHPLGLLVGVVTIGVLNAGIIFVGVPDFWQQIVRGAVLLLALASDQYAVRQRERSAKAEERRSDVPTNGPELTPLAPRTGPGEVALACHHLDKNYGSLTAVQDVSMSVRAGEVVCVVGDNGAGKSTLIKMLSGALEPDRGSIEIAGRPTRLTDPATARAAGIQTVYQDLALCPNLGAAFNLVLGAEPARTRWGLLSIRDDVGGKVLARQRLGALKIGLDDFDRPVRLLSGGQRQAVAIARAVHEGVRVLVLDEPTAALGVQQTHRVLDLVRTLADSGTAVVFISHDIETIFAIADRLVVLRLGRVVYDGPRANVSRGRLVHLIAGLEAVAEFGGTQDAPVLV